MECKGWKYILDANFVLANAQIPETFPIVYCSDGFCELTGIGRCKVMRKSCSVRPVFKLITRSQIGNFSPASDRLIWISIASIWKPLKDFFGAKKRRKKFEMELTKLLRIKLNIGIGLLRNKNYVLIITLKHWRYKPTKATPVNSIWTMILLCASSILSQSKMKMGESFSF